MGLNAESGFFLGLADRVIVTADSVSMMTEACVTERPVYLYDTGEGMTSMKDNPWLDGAQASDAVVGAEGELHVHVAVEVPGLKDPVAERPNHSDL